MKRRDVVSMATSAVAVVSVVTLAPPFAKGQATAANTPRNRDAAIEVTNQIAGVRQLP